MCKTYKPESSRPPLLLSSLFPSSNLGSQNSAATIHPCCWDLQPRLGRKGGANEGRGVNACGRPRSTASVQLGGCPLRSQTARSHGDEPLRPFCLAPPFARWSHLGCFPREGQEPIFLVLTTVAILSNSSEWGRAELVSLTLRVPCFSTAYWSFLAPSVCLFC